jgi:hypothetical protein
VNPQLLRRIAIAVVVLLVLWAAARLLPKGGDRLTGDFRFTRIAADSADSVVIRGTNDTVVLARVGPGRWTVNGFATSPGTIVELFQAFQDSGPAELVARSASSFARLGVDSVGGRRVRVVHGGRSVMDLVVSDQGPDYQSAYVRAAGDSAVYTVAGGFGAAARRRQDDWRDRTVARVAADSVREIDLERGTRRTVLRKADGGWRMASGTATDSAAVHSLLEHYRTIMAASFPSRAQLDSVFRGKVERRVTLRGAAGTLLALEFDSTAGGFWLRRVGAPRDSTYRMSTYDVDQLFPADSTLRKR